MPNHVTTQCAVSGPSEDVAKFRADLFEGDEPFDFNKIIPTPPEIEGTESSTHAQMGLYALRGLYAGFLARKPSPISWEQFRAEYPRAAPAFINSREEFLEWLKKEKPQAVLAGEKSAQAYDATGFTDWYEWNKAHWGTKWSSYEVKVHLHDVPGGQFLFEFQTAWSFPAPIFEKLLLMYPTLTFTIATYDEGDAFAGEGVYSSTVNTYEEFRPAKNESRARAVYKKVYGKFPEEESYEDED